MKRSIYYKDLDNSDKEHYLDLAVSCELQMYIKMYNKLKKSGVSDLEILKLRGLPVGYKEVEEMLISGSIFFEKDDNKNGLIYARIRSK